MLDRFHSKAHRYNHHTSPTPGYFDSASDPIAPPEDPFKGEFYVAGSVSATYVEGLSGVRVGGGANRGSVIAGPLTTFRTYTLPNSSGTVLLDTTIASYLSAGPDAYITSSMVWVDSLSGSDLSGARERPDKPFKTLNAAQGVSVAGDLIFVRPGVYTEVNMGKDGVDWYFEENTQLSANAPSYPFFNYTSKNYNVYGMAEFIVVGSINPYTNALIANFGGSSGTADLHFEFNSINVNSSAALVDEPTNGLFKGTLGTSNLTIHGNWINAPKAPVFSALKSGVAGTYNVACNIERSVVTQNLSFDSFVNLSGYVSSPVISATDYLYDDGGQAGAVDKLRITGKDLHGSFFKSTTTGSIVVQGVSLDITPRSGAFWDTTADGVVTIYSHSVSADLPLDLNDFKLKTSSLTINNSLSSASYGVSYVGDVQLDADLMTVTYATSGFSGFYTTVDGSKLVANVYEVSDLSQTGFFVTYVDSTSGNKLDFKSNTIRTGDFYLVGTDLKTKVTVRGLDEGQVYFTALSGSTDSVLFLDGLYHTSNDTNVFVEGVSGQSGTKMYLKGGAMLVADLSGSNSIDLTNFAGNELDIYILGTVPTNQAPLDPIANFNVKCGQFETEGSIEYPVL